MKKRLSVEVAAAAGRSGRWKNQMRRAAHNGCCRRVALVRALSSVLCRFLEAEGLTKSLESTEIPLVVFWKFSFLVKATLIFSIYLQTDDSHDHHKLLNQLIQFKFLSLVILPMFCWIAFLIISGICLKVKGRKLRKKIT